MWARLSWPQVHAKTFGVNLRLEGMCEEMKGEAKSKKIKKIGFNDKK